MYAIRNFSTKDLSNIIKEFEIIFKVPYVKIIPKHDPSSRYYLLVECIAEYMMICEEYNRQVHGGYGEETAPPSNVNDTDEYESKEIIVHEIL